MMEISNLIPHIEALIFASEKPLTTLEITDLINQAFGFMEDKITLDQIESAIEGILEKYKAEFYPFEVRESGGGWQFLTKKDFHKTVAQLNGDKFLKRLSTAALETLSIVAYKQPVTKSEIEAIRGVSSDYAIQKLLEKDLIVITGRNETMPGHPLVYGTSKNFMDYFGLNSTDDLPKLKEVLDDSIVAPTVVGGEASAAPAEGDAEAEGVLPSENGVHLNGTEVSFSEEEGAEDEVQPAPGQEVSDEEDENVEEADDSYEMDTDEEAIAEEAEALDEEAGEVLDEIAEEGFDEDDAEAFSDEEGEEGFEEEEAYITPEEEEEVEDDSISFAVDDNGELIEENQHRDGGDEDKDDEEKDEDDEEKK
jgi:segregation and condensation protein B